MYPASNLPNLYEWVSSVLCWFNHQKAGKEKYIYQGSAQLLHQAVGWPPQLMSSCDISRDPAQAAEQYFWMPFWCRVWEYSQPIQSLHPHPSMHCSGNDNYRWGESWKPFFCNLTVLSSFENKHLRQLCTVCTHRYSQSCASCLVHWSTNVYWFCSFPFQSFLWVTREEDRGLINFGLQFYSFTFGWMYCMKSNAFAAKSKRRSLGFRSTIWYFKAWLFSHLKMTIDFALSDFPPKSWCKSDFFQHCVAFPMMMHFWIRNQYCWLLCALQVWWYVLNT